MKLSYEVKEDDSNLEPIEIEIHGKTLAGDPIEPQVFDCVKRQNGALMSDVLRRAGTGGNWVANVDYVEQCVVPDQRRRYSQFVRREDIDLDYEMLTQIGKDLAEEYAKRPTKRSSN